MAAELELRGMSVKDAALALAVVVGLLAGAVIIAIALAT
jgi:hypothetical protein